MKWKRAKEMHLQRWWMERKMKRPEKGERAGSGVRGEVTTGRTGE